MTTKTLLISAAALALAAPAVHADFDVSPSVSTGQIVTGAFEDATDTYVPNVRIFGPYAFGEDPAADPYFLQDPGFHPQPGTGFTAGQSVSASVITGLQYWNGTGPVTFDEVPGVETLRLSRGSSSLTISTASDPVPAGSLTIEPSVGPTGEFDDHLDSSLLGSTNGDPAEGIYLVSLGLSATEPDLARSAPFYVLYNNGLSDAAADRAAIYTRDTFAPGTNLPGVPEPASLGLIGLGGLALVRRARR